MLKLILYCIFIVTPFIFKIVSYISGVYFVVERSKDPSSLKIMFEYICNYFTGNTPLYAHITAFIIVSLLVLPKHYTYRRIAWFKQKADVPSLLKIQVQEDGNSYVDIGFTDGLSLEDGQRCILGIKIHNTSNKDIDNVQVYINVLNAYSNQLQGKSLIYLHYTDTDECMVSFSPDQTRSVNVLSYINTHCSCDFSIEQFNVQRKPEIFISETTPCKIEITITGKRIVSTKQAFEVFMISKAQYDSLSTKQRIFMKRV